MKLDWSKIVTSHLEIVKRNNNNLFKFFESNIEKPYLSWTPLDNFEPDTTSGPWEIADKSIFAERFLVNFEANKFEQFFIAGPMVKIRRRKGLIPLFYKEVSLKKNRSGFKLSPQSSKWSITPGLHEYMEEIIQIGNTREMVNELFETANVQLRNGKSLSKALYDEVQSFAGDTSFEEFVEFTSFDSVDSNWIIFATEDRFGRFDGNIGRDYLSMKKWLDDKPKNIGGLSVLEKSQKQKDYKENPPFEVVDLDESQRKCVQALMSDRPLTVITGPPGTGKSQVVVSTLLNAWANKKTALFVSNNNRAVEVVRERLQAYKEEMPMFVRTGSRDYNNQSETLNEIMDIISDYEPDNNRIKKLDKKDKEIKETIEGINKQLKTGELKKITEAYSSALSAYKATSAILKEIDRKESDIHENIRAYGSFESAEELESATSATEELYSSGLEMKKLYDAKKKETGTFETRLKSSRKLREQHAKDIGIETDDSTDWEFIEETPCSEYEEAYKECRGAAKVLGDIPAPEDGQWSDIYDSWESPSDAEKAKETADQIVEILEEQGEEISRVFELNQDLENKKKDSLKECKNLGYESGAEREKSLYQNWITNWKKYLNSPKSDLDDIPIIKIFTARSSALHELEKTEAILFQSFPVTKVNALQPIKDEVRKHFSEEVEMLFQDAEINEQFESVKTDLEKLNSTIKRLNELAKDCSFKEINGELNSKNLKSIIESAKEHSTLCFKGISAIEKNNKWIVQKRTLKLSVEQLLSNNQGSKVIRGWKNHSGSICYQILEEIRQNPSSDNNNRFLDEIYKGTFDNLLDNWKNIEKMCRDIVSLESSIKDINADALYDEWILSSEDKLLKSIEVDAKEGSFEDLNKISNAMQIAKKIAGDWILFDEEERPKLNEKYKYEIKRSVEQLESAVELIPENKEVKSKPVLDQIKDNPEMEWPLGELSELFVNYNSEAINNRLEAQKRLLNENEFHRIKELWLSDITKDESVSDAIESIIQLEGKAIDDQGDKFSEMFEKVIKVMPIWISTAQSLQSVPMIAGLFDLVIIDEASQCTTTSVLPVIFRGKRVGMIGDPHQLPPIYTIKTREEEDEIIINQGMDKDEYPSTLRHFGTDAWRSSWSSLTRIDKNTFSLKNHYRSDPQIIGFSNANIYRSGLHISKKSVQNLNPSIETGVHMIQVSGSSERDAGSRSLFNEMELEEVVKKAEKLCGDYPNLEIGIVSPYRHQIEKIKQKLESAGIIENILCGTADTFQGDERDIVIFSPVISNGSESGSRNWVEKPHNRINVAVTRARHSLYVIGDIQFCSTQCSGILQKLAIYCRNINKLREANSIGELELHKLLTLNGHNPDIHPIILDMEVDFLIKNENGIKLVIEVDGRQHEEQEASDEARDATLRAQGYEVCRLESRDVLDRPIEAVSRIEELLQ